MSFTRRRMESSCINGGDYKRPLPVNTTCQCSATDVECDWGWARDCHKCTQLPDDKLPTCPHVKDGSYRVSSSGFRLVHGDVCSGVDKIIFDTDGKGTGTGPAPPPSRRRRGGGGRSALFTLFVLLLIVAGLAAAWFGFVASPAQKAGALELAGAAGVFCCGLWALAADGFGALLARVGAGAGALRLGGRGGAYAPLDEELNYFEPLPHAEDVQTLVPPPLQRASTGDGGGGGGGANGGGGGGGGGFDPREDGGDDDDGVFRL
ncbi:hypothetical protein MNEG_11365 [Monoraphidium neglectum]|uniref:Sortilin C-terminal domain-containing protein n=1 Tax=Monoraphidium neglectum TaxID=145388 RepID=A0A0D2M5T8_9CHLO|nr:hypothetical protein MNEG_11365 [Monoraphidium neglectum]KIY96596.1 hypothetical protein MNEG_11365 [Monoraphidium neglectum]|eukprot:XP_013895616.1 hypothetical protein MNEG_11365 [Monoraphidium neglectum]